MCDWIDGGHLAGRPIGTWKEGRPHRARERLRHPEGMSSSRSATPSCSPTAGHKSPTLTEPMQRPQSVYAATILYVVAIGIAKLSIIVLIGRLTLTKMHLKILQALSAVVVAWTVVAVLVTAFECRLPKPWDLFGRQCLDPVSKRLLPPFSPIDRNSQLPAPDTPVNSQPR